MKVVMNTAKDRLLKIIDETPEQEEDKILDFEEFLKVKSDKI
ncbi:MULTISPECIES: hypothetical protein [Oceanobacillus]|nr:hypothetical protein [Oceanobacillus oncorhynchi]UUI41291.1 hypothetical protein NP440_06990 [Oceanobacillus oncorhynchi]